MGVMIEQQIEKKVLAKIESRLNDAGIEKVQLVGQLDAVEGVKGIEASDSDVIIVAKASPRAYSTPTIPTCQIDVQVSALVRADIDYNGMNYLAVSDKLMDIFQHWQRCYDDTHEDFTIADEFDCTGFQLGGGNFTLDATGKTWQYQHNFTVFGVVLEHLNNNENEV